VDELVPDPVLLLVVVLDVLPDDEDDADDEEDDSDDEEDDSGDEAPPSDGFARLSVR